jgi:hypothetical protein
MLRGRNVGSLRWLVDCALVGTVTAKQEVWAESLGDVGQFPLVRSDTEVQWQRRGLVLDRDRAGLWMRPTSQRFFAARVPPVLGRVPGDHRHCTNRSGAATSGMTTGSDGYQLTPGLNDLS